MEATRVRVVTDSTADMEQEDAQSLDVAVVPHTIHWGEASYRDRVDMSVQEFYGRLRESKETPHTSRLSPGLLAEVYERLLSQGAESIVSLHLSSKLSGTFESAQLAAREIAPDRIAVVDSLTLSGSLGILVSRVARLAAAGGSMPECLDLANSIIPRLRLFIVLDTLEFLRRGGRIGRVQAMAASVLSIKPIIQVLDGVFLPVERVRTRTTAVRRTAELVRDLGDIEQAVALYGDDSSPARELKSLMESFRVQIDSRLYTTGPACGVHAGPGVFGIGVLLAG
jgi:DegV family protein with EDD domain